MNRKRDACRIADQADAWTSEERLEAVGVRFIRVNDMDVKKDIKNVVWAIAGKIDELHQ